MMQEQKKEWIRQRFGNVDEKILGNINEVKEIVFPEMAEDHHVNGNTLHYQMLDVNKYASRIAEIYRNAIDEMIGNSEYEWHHSAENIVEKVKTGNWCFYGCFLNGELIAVESMFIIRGQRAIQWVWGCVDPVYRGSGVWQNFGRFNDRMIEKSGAQMGIVWVATTHPYSQMTAESAGYKPIGCFIGGEFLGGSDGKYYRQNVIYYSKLYNDGLKYLQDFETMKLTPSAQKLVDTVKELWLEK